MTGSSAQKQAWNPAWGWMSGLPGWLSGAVADPAVRYGIKFGLAGVAAVFVSLVLRLDTPGWALFTVFVLMTAQFVGAIAEKSVYRLAGTIVGGVVGYLLTGSLEQEPILYLTSLGLVIGGSTALFGQSRYPYAFFLCGMTTLVVSSNGMNDPATSWEFMISRIEEIFIGIVVVLLVQSLLWPRYAREEFLASLHAAFGDLRTCFLEAPGLQPDEAPSGGALRAQDFPARITALRQLIEFGSRESHFFRAKLHIYYELTACLGKIAYAIGTLREAVREDSPYRVHAGRQAQAVQVALGDALADLETGDSTPASRQRIAARLASSFQDLDDAFMDMRARNLVKSIPAGQAMNLGLHVLALDEIRAQVERAHALIAQLGADPLGEEKRPVSAAPPFPPPFWIRTGIKSGLAVMVAMLIANWLNPPGAPMFILGTWLFTALNAASPGGQGDHRAFHLIPGIVAGLAAVSMALLALSPMLSSYAVMNTILFVWLFLWGYHSFTTRGMTIPMQLSMLVVVSILGLNGQHPVPFQAIVNFFFGLVLALVASSLLQRLIWPSLPQWETRDRFVEMIGICRKLLAREEMPLWIKTRLAMIPGEVGARLPHLTPPICPEGETARLAALMQTLVNMGGNLSVSLDRMKIPEDRAKEGQSRLKAIESLLSAGLETIQGGFEQHPGRPVEPDAVQAALQSLREWIAATRLEMLAQNCAPLESARLSGFGERYVLLAGDLLEAQRQFAALRLSLYMGDFSL